jgi:3-methyl-2-oxobutanoate hydroxymethyltransferase
MSRKKITTTSLSARKGSGEKIVVVTAYDATMAKLLDEAGVDVLMVGDSLGMVVQGRDNTLSVSLDEMAYHCRAVTRTRPTAHVVCDLPFLSYQVTPEDALRAAGHLVKVGGAESVKLEGGRSVAASVRKIVEAGIPVMGHLGLTPQSVHRFGGFRVQGKTRAAAERLVDDARALEEAGAYSIVIEGVPTEVAARMTDAVSVPTIGIGAGPQTDGQVLVCYDFLGMYPDLSPKFVRRFRQLGDEVKAATREYAAAVRDGSFPAEEHEFQMSEGESLPKSEGKD